MAGKPLKKSSTPGMSTRQLVDEVPEGCSAPDFEQKPVTLAVQEGKNAIFRAVVRGEPRPQVHWLCTRGALCNSSKYQISSPSGQEQHTLQINKLTGEDTDLYRCVATNMYGEAVCSARLTVIEVGFRKNRKRHKEPQEDLRKSLIDFRKMLKKRVPPPAPEKKMDPEQIWQLLMAADRKDYEQICQRYGIVDYRGMLRQLREMRQVQEDEAAQYVNAVSNLRHVKVTKEGIATFDLELDLKDPESKVYLYKDGEMIPYGSDNQTKHCLRRLGKRYHFQIRDLRPEDAGLYQVKVEGADIFSTELEAAAIPPRVVVPLAAACCEEQGDAVFECTLSSPCPNAAWRFQHRPLRPSPKYEVFVSPDERTHRLVVRGADLSDMGLYSLGTGLHTSGAWLVVDAGKDKGLLTSKADHQLLAQGTQASEAEDSRHISGKRGKPRQQGSGASWEGSLKRVGPASGPQLTASLDSSGLGEHGCSLMRSEGAADSAWGPGQVGKSFLEAEGDIITLSGENEPHREGGSFPERPQGQEEGPEPGLGLMGGRQQEHGRDRDRNRCGGIAGGWEAGSGPPQIAELRRNSKEKGHREDSGSQPARSDQGPLWGAHLVPGMEKRVLQGSQSSSVGSWSEGEVMVKSLQEENLRELKGGDGPSRERARRASGAVWGRCMGPGEAGDSEGVGGPGAPESPGGRGPNCKANMGPGCWGSAGGGDADCGDTGGYWDPGESLDQGALGQDFQAPAGRKFLLEQGHPKPQDESLLQEAGIKGLGESGIGERGYETSPGGPGGPRGYEGGTQELRGREGQDTEALGQAGDGSGSLQYPQGRTAGQRGAGGSGRVEAESTGPWDNTGSRLSKTGAHHGPGVLGSGGEQGGMASTLVPGLMGSGQRVDVRSQRLILSPGLGAQGPQGTRGDTDGLRGPGAKESEPNFWSGTWCSRGKGPRGELGSEAGIGGSGGMESRHGQGVGYSSGLAREMGPSRGTGGAIASEASAGGGGHRQGSGVPEGMRSGNKDGYGLPRRESGRFASLGNGAGGPDGGLLDEAKMHLGVKGAGPGGWCRSGGGLQAPGAAGGGGRESSRASATVGPAGDGHVGPEPGVPVETRPWGQAGACGGSRTTGTLGALGEGGPEDGSGGPEAEEPGSLTARGKGRDGEGTSGLGARTSGTAAGSGGGTRHPEAPAPHPRSGSESQWTPGSGSVLGDEAGSTTPGSWQTGDKTAYRGGLRGLGSGGLGLGGEAGFRDDIGGSGRKGSADEVGHRKDWGTGSGGEAGPQGGLGDPEGMGSSRGAGHQGGLGGPGRIGPGGEAGHRGGLGTPGTIRSGGEADHWSGFGSTERMGSGSEACHQGGLGDPGRFGSGGEAGDQGGLRDPGRIGPGNEAGHVGGLGDPGRIGSGGEAGRRVGLEGPGRNLLGSKAGHGGVLGSTRGVESGSEIGHRGGSGGSVEAGSEGEMALRDSSGSLGPAGSLAGVRCEGAPGGHESAEQRPECRATSAEPHGGIGTKDGSRRSRGVGLGEGAGPGLGPGKAATLATADGPAPGDSPRGSGWLGTQGGHCLSDGQGFGGSGPSGIPEELGAIRSQGKPGAREWQDGSGAPQAPGDRDSPSREGWCADQAGGVQPNGLLQGRGAVEGETWLGTALPSGHEQNSWKMGSGTAENSSAQGSGGSAPQKEGDLLLGGSRLEAGGGHAAGPGQALDSSGMLGERGTWPLGSANGPGITRAWVPDLENQGLSQGGVGGGGQPISSRESCSPQEKEGTFRGTHVGPGSSRKPGRFSGQETGGCQGPWVLGSKDSGPGRGRFSCPGDSSVLDRGTSHRRNGLTPKPGDSGPQEAWEGLDGPFGRKDLGDRSGGTQSLGSQLGEGQGGRKGFLGARIDKTRGLRTLKVNEGWRVGSDRSDWRPGPPRNRCQTPPGTEAGAARRGGAVEARGVGQPPVGGNRGPLEEAPCEGQSQVPLSGLGSRRRSREDRLGVYSEGRKATQSSGARYQPDACRFSKEALGPTGLFSPGLADMDVQQGEPTVLSCTLTRDLGPGAWLKDGVKLSAQDGAVFEQDGCEPRLLSGHVLGPQARRYTTAGGQQSEATLTSQGPPILAPEVTERLEEPLVVKARQPVTVKITFQSCLPVRAVWRKYGTQVVGSSSSRGAQVTLGDSFTWLGLPSASRKDGGQYSVTLRSEGGSSQAQLTLQVLDRPQPPQGPLELQDCQGAGVCLRWRPPQDDGGWAVEHYMVERRQVGRSTWLKVGEPPADSTTFTDARVERGRKFAFRVRTVSAEGAGEALESEEVLMAPEALPGPPSTPAILSASSQGIGLMWTAPQRPGSAHITGYLIEKRQRGSNNWTAVNKQPVPDRRWTVVDVQQGCQYEFRVTAVTLSGPGAPGPPSDAVFARDPVRPPGLVRDLQVTDTSSTSVTLSWAWSDVQGRDEAQGYVVELCGPDSLQWSPCHSGTVPVTTYTAQGLRPQESYLVRATAVNDGGHSPAMVLDTLVQAMPRTVSPKFLMDSSTKDSLTVRVGDTIHVPVPFVAGPLPEVTWLKEGLPLPKRSVTSTDDGLTQLLVPAASLSDSGLYTVVLRDLQGKEATYNFLLRVAASPQAPGRIRLQENAPGTVTAEWEPSPDEAAGVPLHYTVLTRSSALGPWREAAARVHTNRFTLLGVLPGHEYHFRVVAETELGTSKPSDTSRPWCVPRQQRDKFRVRTPSYREPDLSQKPQFLVGLRAHLLPRGCQCCMSCAVRGWPRPHITWFKNGQSLAGNPDVYSTDILGVCSLVIPSVSLKDSGEYKAVAENMLGQAVSTATLIVIEPSC